MTDDDKRLRELATKATPGPWRNGADPCHFDSPEVTDDKTFSYYVRTDRDAAFIAAANPAAVLTLLDRLQRAEMELASIRAVSDPDNELSIESTTRDRMMHWCEAAGHLPRLSRLVEEARSERDAARKGWSGEAQAHDEFRAQTGQLCDRLMRERDAALADVERLTKERDAAVHARKQASCAVVIAQEWIAEREAARDAALAHVNELRKERDAVVAEAERIKAERDALIYGPTVEAASAVVERSTAERIAAWADDEAEAMDIAWKHAPTTREADACRQEAASLRQFAVDIRAGAWKEQGK